MDQPKDTQTIDAAPARPAGPEVAALVLLAATPLIYLPGVTFEYTHLKQAAFQIVAIIGLLVMVLRVGNPAQWLKPRLALVAPAAGLLAWMFLSLAWHHHRWSAPAALVRETTFFAGFIGLAFLLSSPATRKLFVRWLGPAAILAAALIIFYLSRGDLNYFGNRNLAGGFLVLPITVMVAYIIGPTERISSVRYWSLVAGLFVMAYALLLSASQGEMEATQSFRAWAYDFARKMANGAIAGTAVGVFLLCCVFFRRARIYLIAAAAAIAVAAAVALTSKAGTASELVGIRRYLWEGALNMIASAPLLGQGAGGYLAAVRAFQPLEYYAQPAMAPVTLHPHCYPLEVMAELGIGGMLLYAALLAGLFIAARRAMQNAAGNVDRCVIAGIACGIAGMVVNSLVSVTATEPGSQINFWLGAAFICGAMAAPAPRTSPAAEKAGIPRQTLIAAGLALLLAFAFYMTSARSFEAQYCLARAVRTTQPDQRMALMLKARNAQPWEDGLKLAARLRLAAEYARQGKLDRTLAEYLEIEKLSPDYQGIDMSIANICLLMNNPPAAAAYAERSVASNPFNGVAYNIWLSALRAGAAAPPPSRAIELIDRALKARPLDPVLVAVQAGFYKQAGNAAKAAELYATASGQCAAITKDLGANLDAAVNMFNLWMQIGTESGSEEVFRQAAQSLERLPIGSVTAQGARIPLDLYYLLGAFYHKGGQKEKAEKLLRDVAGVCLRAQRPGQPDDPKILEMLARIYSIIDPKLSVEAARKLLKIDPGNQVALQIIYTQSK